MFSFFKKRTLPFNYNSLKDNDLLSLIVDEVDNSTEELIKFYKKLNLFNSFSTEQEILWRMESFTLFFYGVLEILQMLNIPAPQSLLKLHYQSKVRENAHDLITNALKKNFPSFSHSYFEEREELFKDEIYNTISSEHLSIIAFGVIFISPLEKIRSSEFDDEKNEYPISDIFLSKSKSGYALPTSLAIADILKQLYMSFKDRVQK